MKSLGKTLKDARELIPFTLRQVEEAAGISNAYLSQLENDKIKKPSANILYKLSCIYRIELSELLYAAGIITEEDNALKAIRGTGSLINNLTSEEKEQLLEYLKFLRHKK
jgi:transcriptional regulator with XRE-family HTH domain